jgi:hypothetical protein
LFLPCVIHARTSKASDLLLRVQIFFVSTVAHRINAKVEYYKHQNHNQPSIILTIEGSDPVLKNEIIIIGGHGDQIEVYETVEIQRTL